MKYAIPIFDGQVSMHFGQSTEFKIIDTDGKRILRSEVMAVTPHSCGSLPKLLADHGVNVVLAGGMGAAPRMVFERCGVEVVLGVAEPNPEKAVLDHVNRTLVSGQNVCDHGDAPCDNHEAHHGQHHA
jgi:predicted Fe-Mo cluster-binding NifX family protein